MSELEKKVLEGNLEADEVKEEKEEVAMETETAAPEEAVEKPEEECAEEDTAEQEDQTEEAQDEPAKEKAERMSKKETISEKRRKTMVTDSQYLRYIAEMRKADSELAIAKAQSAELVMQMDRFKKHYVEYEKNMAKLLQNIDENYSVQKTELLNLSGEIRKNSASMESKIDEEIGRLSEELKRKQRIKFFLLLVSSITFPIVLILMILSMCNII